jgi:hypothetical protein
MPEHDQSRPLAGPIGIVQRELAGLMAAEQQMIQSRPKARIGEPAQ